MGWYFLSPSASRSKLEAELGKLQVQTTAVGEQSYRSGSCFDTCASASQVSAIPSTSDYDALYNSYKTKLEQQGYTLQTTQDEFTLPTYANGSPSGRYLQINAKGSNKYQLQIQFQNNLGEPSMTQPTGNSVVSVDQAVYSLSANTR